MKIHRFVSVLLVVFITYILMAFMPYSLKKRSASNFSFPDTQGKMISMQDFQGKILVLNFWATWSGPSFRTIQELEKINREFSAENVQVIGIAILSKEEMIPQRIKETGVTYPVLLGEKSIIAKYGNFSSIPNTFVIDRQGEIQAEIPGSYKADEIGKIIKQILKDEDIRTQHSTKMASD